MPTITAGNSQTITLGAADAYTVTIAAGGEAYVDLLSGAPGSPSASFRLAGPTSSRTFGPYGVAAQIRVRVAAGSASYGSPAPENPSATLSKTQVDRLKALSQSGLRATLLADMQNGSAVYHAYGNSIVADTSFLGALAGSSEGRFSPGLNSGVSGFTSAQVYAKLQAEGLAPFAAVMPLMEGTNDSSSSVPAAEHAANMRAAAQFAIDRGVVPLLMLVPPTDLTARLPSVKSYYMAEYCLARELGAPIIDPWARFRDSDGTWTAGASTDSIHPVGSVSHQAGVDAWEAISSGAAPYMLPLSNAGEGNGYLLGNVLGLTDSNADGIPDNWTLTGLSGHTVNPLSDFAHPLRGKRVSISYNQSAAAVIQRLSSSVSPAIGDRLLLSGIVGLSSSANTRLRVYASFSGSTAGQQHVCVFNGNAPERYVQLETELPAGTTQIQLTLRLEPISAGAMSGTITFGSWDCYNLSAYAV